MKRILLLILMTALTTITFSQQGDSLKALTKQDYLKKSKQQKTTGIVLLGVGTSMAIAGIIVGNGGNNSNDMYGANFEAGTWMLLGGIVTDLVSIPFFVTSAKNAGRAATISLNSQKVCLPVNNAVTRVQPTISLKIRI